MSLVDRLQTIVWLHEDLWSRLGQHHPERMKAFLAQEWDPFYVTYTQLLPRLSDSDVDVIRDLITQLHAIRESAKRQGIEVPSIQQSVNIAVQGETMSDYVPDDFKAKCIAKISSDNVLTVKCSLGTGPRWERTVDLKPMIDYVHQHLIDYHRQLHGDTIVSGGLGDLLSDAVNAVSSIVKDKTVQSIFNDATPILETVLPGGTVIASAVKLHDTIVSAKNGNADAGKALAGIKAAAESGDPAGQAALDAATKINKALNAKAAKAASNAASMVSAGLRIGASGSRNSVGLSDHRTNRTGSYANFVNQARNQEGPGAMQGAPGNPTFGMGERSNVGTSPTPTANPYGQPPGYGGYPPPGYGGYPPPYQDPSQGYGGYGGYPPPQAPPQAPPQYDPYAQYGAPPYNPYAYMPTPYGYTDPYSMGYAPSYYGGGYSPPLPVDYSQIPGHVPGDDYGGAYNPYGYQFSGWGYNRPYRDNGGAGQGARSLYNLGLVTEPEKRELIHR